MIIKNLDKGIKTLGDSNALQGVCPAAVYVLEATD